MINTIKVVIIINMLSSWGLNFKLLQSGRIRGFGFSWQVHFLMIFFFLILVGGVYKGSCGLLHYG
jgi:hypothetical protein